MDSVNGWIKAYPQIAQNDWIKKSIPDLFGQMWYLNADDDTAPVNQLLSVAVVPTTSTSTINDVSTSTTAASTGGASATANQAASSKSGATTRAHLHFARTFVGMTAGTILFGLCSP